MQPHVQRRLLAQWARLLGADDRPSAEAEPEAGLLWAGNGPSCELALAQGWQRVGPGPLLRPPRAATRPAAVASAVPARGTQRLPGLPAVPQEPGDTGLRQALKTEQLLMALAREALVLRFLPQRCVAGGQRVAMAATLGLPDPDHHLPETAAAWQAAHQPAHAVLLNQWALQLACREAGRWALAPADQPPALTVPVVAAQLLQRGWLDQLCQTLEHTGLAPERLTLALGARSLLQPQAGLLHVLTELRRLGVRISVARLKAGDALLDRLATLPVDELQVDARLMAQVPGQPMAEATVRRIAALARAQGWRVVADGVCNAAQRHWLASLHCQAFQGALAGSALPARQRLPLAA